MQKIKKHAKLIKTSHIPWRNYRFLSYEKYLYSLILRFFPCFITSKKKVNFMYLQLASIRELQKLTYFCFQIRYNSKGILYIHNAWIMIMITKQDRA